MTDASTYLRNLARQIANAYGTLPTVRAIMLTGSAARGLSDFYSDIDMTMYYDGELPEEEALAQLRGRFGARERSWTIGDREEGSFAEAFDVGGIEVQIGHTTIERWEQTIAGVLENHDVASPAHKAMEGTLACEALLGDEIIAGWKRRIAAYPDALAAAVVSHHLQFFPVWGLEHHFQTRDAPFWYQEILLETVQKILAVLAGLNRLYFTTFQFKRSGDFIEQMDVKPYDLKVRLETLFHMDSAQALPAVESLVAETIALVETHMPELDTAGARRRLGWRHRPWQPAA